MDARHDEDRRTPEGGAAQEQLAEGAYMAFGAALREANVLVGSNCLRPTSGAKSADTNTKVLDGLFAETKEQLGGYY